jgi:hypothetical protein
MPASSFEAAFATFATFATFAAATWHTLRKPAAQAKQAQAC